MNFHQLAFSQFSWSSTLVRRSIRQYHQFSHLQSLRYSRICFAQRRTHPVRSCATAPVVTSPSSTDINSLPKQNVIDILQERGLFDTSTTELETLKELCSSPIGVYTGFDPTADSLHLGNLLAILALAWFQRCGHQVVALVGGATGRVGDPSGKSTERPVLDEQTITNNLKGIERNLKDVLNRSAQQVNVTADIPVPPVKILNNHDWVGPMTFLEFLRDVGKYARLNTMLSKDSVKSRLQTEDGMSFTEFTYQLLQAYDFMYLSDNHDVVVQLGGSDQWGNITAGTELTRKLRSKAVHGVTFPLLTTADGKKFGKSEDGAVWLTSEKLSPYEFYQFLFKTPDEDIIRFLKRLTFLPLDDIAQIEQDMKQSNYIPNTAQRKLAEEVTRIVHGDEGVRIALAATKAAAPGSSAELSIEALEAISNDMPNASMERENVVGISIVDVMVKSGLQKSKSEARRLIKNGGGYLNNKKVQDDKVTVGESDLVGGKLILLAAGKKNKMLVRVN